MGDAEVSRQVEHYHRKVKKGFRGVTVMLSPEADAVMAKYRREHGIDSNSKALAHALYVASGIQPEGYKLKDADLTSDHIEKEEW